MKNNIFTEFGIDFDNNKYGIGYSTEIENEDGTEYRVKKLVKMNNKSLYLRVWVFRKVLVISSKGFAIVSKNRNNFKLVLGISGFNREKINV